MQKTALIVEDEFLIAMDLKAMVERRGWRVLGPVATVANAQRLLEEELPSVALLDIHLGNEVVTPVAEMLSSLGIPFAVASAYDRPDLAGGPVMSGVHNVGKPTSEHRLAEVLRLLTASTQASDRNI
ncbi:response regulator [Mesorhizobium sp. M3A.F.Ca.ET.174.01.1.1]|uniref:response regulator n=1 Tax=unclassified Mesorhizobium TaxID=325217 RepID=UPI00109400F0|nr:MULTISPECIES: response regulator [unclassified Mesorhizobium]TGS71520.1 response regulator [Mesorhizobium sp. M3A.F.Ca.ET.201.01.1.1]TGS82381.1 response regulator [Mesorhizobium sp. M3A.F.Ca.ET.175.01.1.1]TGT22203.1 response regulator [Mesorhizobium sp. M3A.F.Ca.ET.174.01.1.1]